MPLKSGKTASVEEIRNYAAIKGKNITLQEAISIAIIQRAMKGDVKAAAYIRDTIGQKPTDKVELATPIDDILKEMEAYFEQQKETDS